MQDRVNLSCYLLEVKMPYANISDLPDTLGKLPKHAKEIYLAAFNSAFKQYKGNEGQAHGTAWAAVKKSYKQNEDGRWVAKESNVEIKVSEAMSDNDRRAILQSAVTDSLAIGGNAPGPWIKDVFDNELVYEVGGKTFRMSYLIDRKGKVVFGQAERVVPQTVYSPVMESVEAKIEELTNLSSEREDAGEVRESINNLLELLEKEELSEEIAGPHLNKANELIAKLEEAAPMKTEDGQQFPRSAFAFAPEADKPSTWKLRLWEDSTNKVTRGQLGRASAALSPGGFRGNKVEVSKEELPTIKRKIWAEYRKLGVEDNDIPKWVKESDSRELIVEYISLSEAKIDGKGIATIDIIQPGMNSDFSRYYPADMLARDHAIFEGVKMYADHPSKEDELNRPERSIRDWVATLSEVYYDEVANKLRGKATIVESWFKEKVSNLKDQGLLSNLGVSINAIGKGVKSKIEGKSTTVIEKLLAVRSVDFVTEPGAGGFVIAYESKETDVDLIGVEAFRERRPDLISEIESVIKEQINQEVKKKMEMEEKVTELEGQVTTLTAERDQLKEAAEKAEKDKAKAESQATIKEAVDKAELPVAAKTRLLEAHKDDESAEGIEEVIKSEVAYIAALTETGKIKDLGQSGTPDPQTQEKLEEAFTELTGSPEAGKVAAAGR